MESGYDKLLALDVSVAPHAEEPGKAVADLRKHLLQMTELGQNGK